VTVPYYGMVMGLEANVSDDVDLSQIGGTGNTRVSLANTDGDRTMSGTITAASNNVPAAAFGERQPQSSAPPMLSAARAPMRPWWSACRCRTRLVFSGQERHVKATVAPRRIRRRQRQRHPRRRAQRRMRGVALQPATALVCLRLSAATPGAALGGTISTDNTTDAKFGNTDFRLYGGSTLLLDNSAVTTADTDRRLLNTTNLDLTSSTLRLIGDGGAATVSSQTLASIELLRWQHDQVWTPMQPPPMHA